jgi:nucleoporin GLE1
LAKAFLHQAEVEVTAKPSTAFPLGRIVIGLVARAHFDLGEIFMAKLVELTGGWVVGMIVPPKPGQTEAEYRVTLGYRSGESTVQYIDRLTGLLTLYTAILQSPLPPALQSDPSKAPYTFQLARLWTWLARILGTPTLLTNTAAPSLLAAAIETGGDRAVEAWGKQITKIRNTLGRKVMEEGSSNVIGGQEGNAGKVRLGLLLEKWAKEGKLDPVGRQFDT